MMKGDFAHPNARPFQMGEGDDACLLIHGFTGSPSHMRPLGESLMARGFFVEGILLPGHASRIEDMDKTTWKNWLNCAREAANRLHRSHRRVYAAGLSMGGVLSLLLAQEKAVQAVASLAAPMRIFAQRDAALSRLIWPFLRYLPDKERVEESFLDDYDYGYNATPVRRVKDLGRLMRMARRGLSDVTCPVLVVQSHADETVRPVSADIIFSGISSSRKQLMMLDKSPHIVTLGPEREAVFAGVGDFFADL